MPRLVHLKDGTRLSLSDTSFASGGEGDLFRILHPPSFVNQIAKIYKPDKQTLQRKDKIDYLIAHPPLLGAFNAHQPVIWIHQALYENNRFLGFTMALAKGEKLEFLCHAKLPKQLGPEWQKFDFRNPKAFELRLKICFNLAVALYEIHRSGNYVLVDMKPENIMIQANGLISVIDIDSVEVMKNGNILFPAPVATPEYSPPEYYKGVKPEKMGVSEVWDRFSMGVIFYRLLTGIHPFTGSCKSPFDTCNGLPDMVENGLFPHGKKGAYFHIIPFPHSHFKRIKKEIQSLFIRCFEEGHTSPKSRPSAEEWCRALAPQVVPIGKSCPLPSSSVHFDIPFASLPLLYSLPTHVALPSGIAFLNIREPDVLDFLVKAFIGKTAKQELKEKIEWLQDNIKKGMAQKAPLDQALHQFAQRFHQRQDALLKQEREKWDQLQRSFAEKILQFDQSAIALFTKEKKDLQKAQENIALLLSEIEKEHALIQRRWQTLEGTDKSKTKEISTSLHLLQMEQEAYEKAVSTSQETVTRTVDFEKRRQALHDVLSSTQLHRTQNILPLRNALDRHEVNKATIQAEQKAGKHVLIKQVEEKYDRLFDALIKKAVVFEQNTALKATKIKTETEHLLQENAKTASLQYAGLKKEVEAFLAEMNRHLKKLTALQEEYKRW